MKGLLTLRVLTKFNSPRKCEDGLTVYCKAATLIESLPGTEAYDNGPSVAIFCAVFFFAYTRSSNLAQAHTHTHTMLCFDWSFLPKHKRTQ